MAGKPAPNEDQMLDMINTALEVEIKEEWAVSRTDWVAFVEADINKDGEVMHTITSLAEATPVGEVLIDVVKRTDDEAMLATEHETWAGI